jgi:transcriptional regulator with XRE-family HTH domain
MYKDPGKNLTIEQGKMIQAYRESKGISRAKLAKEVNISTSYIHRIEKHTRGAISYPLLKKIATALDTNILTLLGEEIPKEECSLEDKIAAEEILLSREVTVMGRTLDAAERVTLCNILQTLANNKLTRAKKLEHVLSLLY